ncbi:MAG: winged helix-turn-helix domain-containing protein [Lachnospiraceae bacterium]|nr:response regulator transcription factor [Lachnospiraceae bacterium]MDE6815028.1 winged helix-turn-helix domain-containing protein [Lachnospiraceae bacterium]
MKVIIIRTGGEGRSFCRKLSDLAAKEECKPDIVILSRRETLCFPGLQISGTEGRAYRDGRDLNLTHREFELLYFLAGSPGETFEGRAILEAVWGPATENTVKVVANTISDLRRKVEPACGEPVYIRTAPGGYFFQSPQIETSN